MERFSLSTCWLVAPRCRVDTPEPPRNRQSQLRSTERARTQSRGDGDADASRSRALIMEHALLNDEKTLKEIQNTLEGSRMSHDDRNSRAVRIGSRLSNGAE